MADLARIKRNVAKMASMNAPEVDIDGYIASEGVTIDDVRNFRPSAVASSPEESDASKSLREELSGKITNMAKALYDKKPEWQKPIIAAQDIFNTGLNGLSMGLPTKALRSLVPPLRASPTNRNCRACATGRRPAGIGRVGQETLRKLAAPLPCRWASHPVASRWPAAWVPQGGKVSPE